MDRRDIGSWLQGPKAALEDQGMDFGYPGQRLGMPQAGAGSVARMGRRIIALTIDWFACLSLSKLIHRGDITELVKSQSTLTLIVFFIETVLLTVTIGGSFGQRIVGIAVRDVSGQRANPIQVIGRQLLLCLVIPALIWDRDGRGLHDKLTQTVAVKIN